MKHINGFTSAAFLLAISMAATPALAQRKDRGAGATSRAGGQSHESRGGGDQNHAGDQNRATERRAPQQSAPAPRAETRGPVNNAPRAVERSGGNFDRSRGEAVQRVAPRGVYPRSDSRVVIGRPYYSSPYYSRPYYSFRPRLSLGFGLWLGYPVTYPYGVYGYPYPSTYPYPYPAESVAVAPSTNAASGGVSFEISPATATVYVDGQYIGIVSDFTPNMPPLGLTPGRHRIEIRENGFETITFDADIVAGQVLPFQGTMER